MDIGFYAVVAKTNITFEQAGINVQNVEVIYLVDRYIFSYVPGRTINSISAFEKDKGYYIKTKAPIDLTAYVVPPITESMEFKAHLTDPNAHSEIIGKLLQSIMTAINQSSEAKTIAAGAEKKVTDLALTVPYVVKIENNNEIKRPFTIPAGHRLYHILCINKNSNDVISFKVDSFFEASGDVCDTIIDPYNNSSESIDVYSLPRYAEKIFISSTGPADIYLFLIPYLNATDAPSEPPYVPPIS